MNLKGKKVILAGGTGMIGSHLIDALASEGADTALLSRSTKMYKGLKAYQWSTEDGTIDPEALEGVDYIVNLAGAGIADKRWTESRKKVIVESRIKSAELIKRELVKKGIKPLGYLSASAVGYYGDRGDEQLTESSGPGDDFIAKTVVQWENAADSLAELMPVIKVRWGIVLSTKGGALPKMAGPQGFGIGAILGSGKQYYPWIHIDDVARVIIFLLKRENFSGVVNGVSPTPVTQREFVDAIERGMKKPALKLPAPAFAIRMGMGEMASVVLNSHRVVPKKLKEMAYEFKFTDPVEAMRDLAERKI